jgi:hypothetical protein
VANRTVNVNIKYNVNTVEVQKAQAASVAAQKATDQLRKSTDDYAKALKQLPKPIDDIKKNTQGLYQNVNDLYSAVRTVFTAGLAAEVVNISLNMAKLSGNVDGVNKAFQRLPNATLLLNDLQKATHGTVTDLELMQKTLSAQNYKIPLTQLGKLLEFASVKAQQTGQEVNHLVDYIVSGIGLRSIKRLDDLGFTANRLKGALGGVSLQAASMGQVVEAVTKLMNEDLGKTGGFTETSKTKVEQLEVKWQKLGVTISKALTSPALLNFYNNVLDKFTAGVDVILNRGSGNIIKQQAKDQAIKNVENFKEMQLSAEVLKNRQQTLDVIQQEANTTLELIGRNNDEIKNLRARRDELTKTRRYQDREELDNIAESINHYAFKNLALKETIKILKEYLKTVEEETSQEEDQLGLIEAKKQQIQDLNEQLTKAKSPESIYRIRIMIGEAEVELKDLQQGDLVKGNLKIFGNDKIATPVKVKPVFTQEALAGLQKSIDELQKGKPILLAPVTPYLAADFNDKLNQAFQSRKQEIAGTAIDLLQNQATSILAVEANNYSQRIDAAQAFYDQQIQLAGDNERTKKELRIKEDREVAELQRKRADREKKASLAGILINTALGITKAFATAVTVYDGIVQAAIVAGEGASQYAIANRARYYAKGEINIKGPGTETSDSIPAFLSRGESVMTAQETRRSMGLLEAIKHNKIDDRILKGIDFSGGRSMSFSDANIVHEVKAMRGELKHLKAPDLVKHGRTIIETHEDSQGNKRKIRSKSI